MWAIVEVLHGAGETAFTGRGVAQAGAYGGNITPHGAETTFGCGRACPRRIGIGTWEFIAAFLEGWVLVDEPRTVGVEHHRLPGIDGVPPDHVAVLEYFFSCKAGIHT